MYSNFITKFFLKIIKNKDIRNFRKNYFYYLFFRLIRNFLNNCLEVKIYNFKIFASNKKNITSHALLKKCKFDDQSELRLIKKISKKNKILKKFSCKIRMHQSYCNINGAGLAHW